VIFFFLNTFISVYVIIDFLQSSHRIFNFSFIQHQVPLTLLYYNLFPLITLFYILFYFNIRIAAFPYQIQYHTNLLPQEHVLKVSLYFYNYFWSYYLFITFICINHKLLIIKRVLHMHIHLLTIALLSFCKLSHLLLWHDIQLLTFPKWVFQWLLLPSTAVKTYFTLQTLP
jgi:hypothetical protein